MIKALFTVTSVLTIATASQAKDLTCLDNDAAEQGVYLEVDVESYGWTLEDVVSVRNEIVDNLELSTLYVLQDGRIAYVSMVKDQYPIFATSNSEEKATGGFSCGEDEIVDIVRAGIEMIKAEDTILLYNKEGALIGYHNKTIGTKFLDDLKYVK